MGLSKLIQKNIHCQTGVFIVCNKWIRVDTSQGDVPDETPTRVQ